MKGAHVMKSNLKELVLHGDGYGSEDYGILDKQRL